MPCLSAALARQSRRGGVLACPASTALRSLQAVQADKLTCVHAWRSRGPGNVFEVDVDVGSSRAANTVVGMVAPATMSLVISMGVALEGHSEQVR